jgi:hypothetical protein
MIIDRRNFIASAIVLSVPRHSAVGVANNLLRGQTKAASIS